jgi:UDP-N-acetylmuramoyl-tripeptide--D-alanyl-D-alanine ligase
MYSNIPFKTLAEWTGGKLVTQGNNSFFVNRISTDTRTLKPGDIYLALKGESFDGNQFLQQAIQAGAAGVICETSQSVSVPKIQVKDGLAALTAIGRSLRSLFQGKVLGITGSAGKSSTKDMVAVLMGANTVSSPASFNNLMGVSRTLCLVEDKTQSLVLEMGMNNFGEIAELCANFKPHYGLISNIGDAHIGKLGGQDGIYRAKKEMFEFLAQYEGSRGIALNLDDSWVIKAYQTHFLNRLKTDFLVKTYSERDKGADIFLKHCELDSETGFLKLKIQVGQEELNPSLPIFGEHHAQNIIAAIAMAQLGGVSLAEILSRLPSIRPASHRGEVIPLTANKILIDETYNSNPKALLSSLETLKKMAPNRRKVLVLGEMKELGEFSASRHRDIGAFLSSWIQQKQVPLILVTVQGDSHFISDEVKSHCPSSIVEHVTSVEEAAQRVNALLVPGDVVFLKGSRGVKLDRLLTLLK